MKRTACIIAVLLTAVMLLAACASTGKTTTKTTTTTTTVTTTTTGRNVPSKFPDFVKKAIQSDDEDAYVGVGMAKLSNMAQAMDVSANRARAQISQTMESMVRTMANDYQVTSEVDPNASVAFQENIRVTLSKNTLRGARIVDQDFDDSGACWTVVRMSKSSGNEEVNQAINAAKLAVPAMMAFNAIDRMDAAFAKEYGKEVTVGDK
jgi:hypothetical protein